MNRLPRWAAFALVAVVSAATYVNSITNGFALDDNYIIGANPRAHQLADQTAIWLTPYWPNFGEHLGLYRPLTIFGYAVQWVAGDGAPIVFHTVSILLHVAVSLLVLILLLRLASTGAAALGALIFAVHPVHTEVVANVVGQAEMISAAAVLAACILYVERPAAEPGVRRTLAIAGLFIIGLLAKEGAVVLPGLLVALDFATGRAGRSRASFGEWVHTSLRPMLALGLTLAAYLLLRIHVLGSIGGADAAPNLPFLRHGHRFLSALRAWPEYARLLVWPMDLVADYSPGVVLPVEQWSPMVVLGAGLLAGTVALACVTPWLRYAGLPAAWFFISVFPVSNLVLPIGVLLAERILYLPSVAASLAIAFLWDRYQSVAEAWRPKVATALAVGVILVFAVRSALRNPDWASTDAVWDAIVEDHPESYRSQSINGWRMLVDGKKELARGYYELSFRIWGDDAILANNLAGVYIELGQFDKAVPLLERSRELSDLLDYTEIFLAFSYLSTGRPAEALEATLRADHLRGDRVIVFSLRAQAYEGVGRYDWAVGAWRAAIRRRRGDNHTFWMMLARDLARVGSTDEALQAVDSARALVQPESAAWSTANALVTAIRDHCYVVPSGDSAAPESAATCTDPLASWSVVLPPNAQEVANPLQNAIS